jgi:hypothetical protein
MHRCARSLWDSSTALALVDEGIFTFKELQLCAGRLGRTYVCADGRTVRVAVAGDYDRLMRAAASILPAGQ